MIAGFPKHSLNLYGMCRKQGKSVWSEWKVKKSIYENYYFHLDLLIPIYVIIFQPYFIHLNKLFLIASYTIEHLLRLIVTAASETTLEATCTQCKNLSASSCKTLGEQPDFGVTIKAAILPIFYHRRFKLERRDPLTRYVQVPRYGQ